MAGFSSSITGLAVAVLKISLLQAAKWGEEIANEVAEKRDGGSYELALKWLCGVFVAFAKPAPADVSLGQKHFSEDCPFLFCSSEEKFGAVARAVYIIQLIEPLYGDSYIASDVCLSKSNVDKFKTLL